MKQLTRFEELCLEVILRDSKKQAEERLENTYSSLDRYFIENETLPMIENLLTKLEV